MLSLNASRPGAVERSGFGPQTAVLVEAELAAEASTKSLSVAFCASVRLSRFARRSEIVARRGLAAAHALEHLGREPRILRAAGAGTTTSPTRARPARTRRRIATPLRSEANLVTRAARRSDLAQNRQRGKSASEPEPAIFSPRPARASVQQVRLLLDDARIERLELEPAGEGVAGDFIGLRRGFR